MVNIVGCSLDRQGSQIALGGGGQSPTGVGAVPRRKGEAGEEEEHERMA